MKSFQFTIVCVALVILTAMSFIQSVIIYRNSQRTIVVSQQLQAITKGMSDAAL